MKKNQGKLVAKGKYPDSIRLSMGAAEPVVIEAGEGEAKLKKFAMTAYTGAAVRVGFGWPVVVDLTGMSVTAQSLPILKDHDAGQIVGHSSSVDITAQRIKVAGLISGIGDAAQEITALSGNGFPWQASIGAGIDRMEFVDRGQKVTVNGKTFEGPIYVARKTQLNEVSFVAMGADSATSARVAASTQGGSSMTFEQWLEAKGFNAAELGADQKAALKLAFDAEQKAPPTSEAPVVDVKAEAAKAVTEIRAAAQAESTRIAAIKKACQGNAELEAKAISESWSAEKAELEALRAARPQGPAIHVEKGKEFNAGVLEAAACQAIGLNSKTLEAQYKPETLEAAHKHYRSRLSLHELLLSAAWRNGYHGVNLRSDPEGVLRAAFSNADIGGILSNVANKFSLEAYSAVEDTWKAISAVRPVNDFKAITSYRLTGDLEFEEVGSTGELKHGELGEQSYSNQAKTYGKMLALTRTNIINDDLGALAATPRMLGRGGALKLNKVFWTAFMDNSTFFAATHTTAGDTGNANYDEGADTALSIDALTLAEMMFLNQVDDRGNPLGVVPKLLLVPNALSVKAAQFTRDTDIRDTTASTKYSTSNPHAGKWQAIRSSYLSNSTISGNSALAYYLLADPMDVPVIETVFLNNVQVPTVESAEADFNLLGVQMRAVFDFGVAKQDYRGGVKMKGEA